MKHDYTNELELKSLLIRIKNTRKKDGTEKTSKTNVRTDLETIKKNKRINKYIKWYTNILSKKFKNFKKAKDVQQHLKEKIIKLSEDCLVDKFSYEKFGTIIIKMVNHIMTKGQFRGYSYQDDFVSDSVFKILKYLDNFDHKKISKISNQAVNAFAYISQIIHNAILFVIIKKKKEQDFLHQQIQDQRVVLGLPIEDYKPDERIYETVELFDIIDLSEQCLNVVEESKEKLKNKNFRLIIEYNDFSPDIEDYNFIEKFKRTNKNVIIKKSKN